MKGIRMIVLNEGDTFTCPATVWPHPGFTVPQAGDRLNTHDCFPGLGALVVHVYDVQDVRFESNLMVHNGKHGAASVDRS